MQLKPIKTANIEIVSKNKIINLDYDDIYFSTQGAFEESDYNFIFANNLLERWQQLYSNKEHYKLFSIAELGFGTGLNFVNTIKHWSQNLLFNDVNAQLDYVSFELHPLQKKDLIKFWHFYPQYQTFIEPIIEQYPNLTQGIHRIYLSAFKVNLTLVIDEAFEGLCNINFQTDCWFMDGFNPTKNPEIWSLELIELMKFHSHNQTTVSSFSVQKNLIDNLNINGFQTNKKKGFANKRNMLVGQYSQGNKKTTTSKINKVAIVGAGIAGCLTAHTLSEQTNIHIDLIEKQSSICQGGSGAKHSSLFYQPATKHNANHHYYLNAYQFAQNYFSQYLPQHFTQTQSLLLPNSVKSQSKFEKIAQHLLDSKILPKDMIEKVFFEDFAENIKKFAQENQVSMAFKLKHSGWLNIQAACMYLINQSNSIQLKLNTDYNLDYLCKEYDIIILANSYAASEFLPDLAKLISPLAGQSTSFKVFKNITNQQIHQDRTFIFDEKSQQITINASYRPQFSNLQINPKEREENLKYLSSVTQKTVSENTQIKDWTGFRATSLDRLPIVDKYSEQIYLNLAHSSKGVTSAPISAQYLTDLILNRTPCLDKINQFNTSLQRFK